MLPLFLITKETINMIFQRLNPSDLLKSGRGQESLLPIKYMFNNSSIFNIMFGYGPKGFGYVRQFIVYDSGYWQGQQIAVTSHVIFVDFFVEYGLLGLIMIILLFWYLYKLSTQIYIITNNRICQVLCLNQIITSLYSSDYASPHFTVILIIILSIFKDAKKFKSIQSNNAKVFSFI
jgi:hypothetical protein